MFLSTPIYYSIFEENILLSGYLHRGKVSIIFSCLFADYPDDGVYSHPAVTPSGTPDSSLCGSKMMSKFLHRKASGGRNT